MADGTGASKTNIWLDYSGARQCLRDDLEGQAPRAMAVLDPLPLVLENWAEVFGSAGHVEPCQAPAHPQRPELGRGASAWATVWIERDDFAEVPPKGFFRLFPGNKVRLKYGMVVECTGCEKDADGRVTAVRARVVPDTKSGTPGADAVKVKGTITWVGAARRAWPPRCVLYDRLFTEAQPDAGDRDFREPCSTRGSKRWCRPGWSPRTLAAGARRRPLPVRAPRLLRRRPRWSTAPGAGVQPHHHAEGRLGRLANPERGSRPAGWSSAASRKATGPHRPPPTPCACTTAAPSPTARNSTAPTARPTGELSARTASSAAGPKACSS
jgi:hypothetical protein